MPHKMYKGLTDIGTNLDSKQFGNRHQEILESAKAHGVDTVITISNSAKEWQHNLAFCKRFDGKVPLSVVPTHNPVAEPSNTFTMDSPFSYAAIASKGLPKVQDKDKHHVQVQDKDKPKASTVLSTIGIHPHHASECSTSLLKSLTDTVNTNRPYIVAIGECGLDYNRLFSPMDAQKQWFEEQIKLALQLDLPLYCHERESHNDFVAIVSKYPLRDKLVIHCFTGTKEELAKYIEMGFYIGITGFICDPVRGITLQQFVNMIPLDKLMIETDAPFMAPRVKPRIKCNEPKNVVLVAEEVAKRYGLPVTTIIERTTENARRFFRF